MDEPCVYKKVSGSAITFLVLYVDDILLIGNDVRALSYVKMWLSNQFSMKDLGEASTYSRSKYLKIKRRDYWVSHRSIILTGFWLDLAW